MLLSPLRIIGSWGSILFRGGEGRRRQTDNRKSGEKFSLGYNFNMMTTPAQPPLVIAIAGGSGSGKTTVANVILQRVGPHRIAYLQHDLIIVN